MSENMIYSALPYLYGSDSCIQMCPQVIFYLKHNVEKESLVLAVKNVLKANPEFALTISQTEYDYEFSSIHDTAKVPVFSAEEKPDTLGADTYGYLFCISYAENRLYFNFSHALGDGTSCTGVFMRNILKAYLRNGEPMPAGSDDAGKTDIVTDVFQIENFPEAGENTSNIRRNHISYHPDLDTKRFLIQLPRQEFKSFCRDIGVKPYIALLAIINLSLTKSAGKNEFDIKFVVNMRKYFPGKQIAGNCASYANPLIKLDEKQSFAEICRMTEEQLTSALQSEKLLAQLTEVRNTMMEISKMKFPLSVKRRTYKKIMNQLSNADYWFCYNPDCFPDEGLNEEVLSQEVWVVPESSDLGMEVVPRGDVLNVCFSYYMDRSSFFECFMGILTEHDVSFVSKKLSDFQEMPADFATEQ